MKFRRILANAVARRIAFVLVAAALAWFGVGNARAQSCPAPNAGPDVDQTFADEPAAYYACASWGAGESGKNFTGYIRQFTQCVKNGSTSYRAQFSIQKRVTDCSTAGAGTLTSRSYFRFPAGTSCATRPSATTLFLPLGGSTQCWNGCVVSYAQNGDDETSTRSPTGAVCGPDYGDNCPEGSFWNGYMGVCQPIAPDCPEGQTRVGGECKPNNKCPDGMVAVPGGTPGAINQGALYCKPESDTCPPGNVRSPTGQCLPGDGQCAAGEARRPNGTCGRDSDGDGEADEDDDDPDNDPNKPSASGGDSCDMPPSCSGDAIACMQVKIQWRIDCNTRKKANISGGACNAMPVCTGDGCKASEHASMILQWRTACALEKANAGGGTDPGTGESLSDYLSARDAANKSEADASAGQGDGHDGVDESSIFQSFSGSDFNPNLFGGGSPGVCSFSAPLELMGTPIEMTSEWWVLASMIGWLTVASAYIWVAVQLGK